MPQDIVSVHLRNRWLAEGPSELCFDRDAPRMALLLDFIDGPAGDDDRADVRGHILACPRCRFLYIAIRERMENGKSIKS